ncbi:hypothetical protein WA158_006276 [Blastocystis sp. Blastoise]
MNVARYYADAVSQQPEDYMQYEDMEIKWGSPDRYEIVEKVGRGKYSEVFKAVDLQTNQFVSIKYLKPVRKKKIRREIKILQNLNGGPNIIPLVDVVRDPETGAPSLITKWVNNRDFKEFYPSLSDAEIRYYLYKVLVALDYAHSKGIMHRDIKPQNILIDQYSHEVYLIDWGLAEFYQPNVEYNVRVSTRHYKGPELLVNYLKYDYSLDIWGLGCMIAGIIFLKAPFFRGRDNSDQLVKIAEVLGTADLYEYLNTYGAKLDKPTEAIMGKYEHKSWKNYITNENSRYINKDVLDLLDHMLVYDHQKRFSARECMEHPFFASTREIIMKEQTQLGTIPFASEFEQMKGGLMNEMLQVKQKLIAQNEEHIKEQKWEELKTNAEYLICLNDLQKQLELSCCLNDLIIIKQNDEYRVICQSLSE